MALKPTTALTATVAIAVLSLTACQTDGISGGAGSDSTSSPTASESPTVATSSSTEPSADPTEESDGSADADDDSQVSGGSGQVSYVQVGDVRYEAESMQCSRNDGGFEFGGNATGPYPGQITIGGVFGVGSAEDPPDVAFAFFDAGEGGQWSAMSEVSGFSIGSLASVSYSAAGASGDGAFAFHIEGDVDDNPESGSFEFFC